MLSLKKYKKLTQFFTGYRFALEFEWYRISVNIGYRISVNKIPEYSNNAAPLRIICVK